MKKFIVIVIGILIAATFIGCDNINFNNETEASALTENIITESIETEVEEIEVDMFYPDGSVIDGFEFITD